MKRLIAVLCVAIMFLATSVSVAAAREDFVQSPSSSGAPSIVEGDTDSSIVITAYRDRLSELESSEVEAFEDAYNSVIAVSSVVDLVPEIAKEANKLKVDLSYVAISDLFYVKASGKGDRVSIKSSMFTNFISLLSFDGEKWNVVEVEIDEKGVISFTSDGGIYAVAVSSGPIPQRGADSCSTFINIWIIICIIAAIILITWIVYKRRKEDKDEK